jgi:hypothetical protein
MDDLKLGSFEQARRWWRNSHIQWPTEGTEMAHLLAFYASHVTMELREKLEWCESGRDNVAMENRELRAERDAALARVEQLVAALTKISTSFQSYDHEKLARFEGPYRIGVVDGHRLAAKWAREALAANKDVEK